MPLALGKCAWNTIWLPVRLAWTTVYGGLDAVNTVVTLPKQSFEIVSDTTQKIKDVLNNSRNEWKWYRKIRRIPFGTLVAAWTAIEWTWRAILNPSWNAILHSRDVLGNFLVNPWNAIKSVLSDKPVSDFKYEHLKTRDISKNNWMANLITGGKKSEKKEAKPEEKKEDKPKEEAKPEEKKEEVKDNKEIISLKEKMSKMEEQMKIISDQLAKVLKDNEEKKGGMKIVKWAPKPKINTKPAEDTPVIWEETPAMAA